MVTVLLLALLPFLLPVYGFPSSVPTAAGSCRERSQSELSPPAGFASLTQNPGLAATVTGRAALWSRRGLRSRHPGKATPDKAQRRFAHALSVVAAGPCSLPAEVPHTRMSPCRRGDDSHNLPRTDCPVVNEQPTKFFTQNPVKSFAFCPGQVRQAVAVMPLAAKVLKRVKFIPQGIQQQVPAKRQNRGSRNSTGDVL